MLKNIQSKIASWGITICFTSICALSVALVGCGFHLRGHFLIPPDLKYLALCPNEPFDPFQKVLIRTFKTNGVKIVDPITLPEELNIPTINILCQNFTETPIAYGSDAQTTRSTLKLTVDYQISTPTGELVPRTSIIVQRDLDINPNATLGTVYERDILKQDLYLDAATQLIRQFSLMILKCQS